MAENSRGLPVFALIFLIIGAVVFTVGIALPYWVEWDERGLHCGLWHTCGESCSALTYDEFIVPELSETEMPSQWIVTQGLSCTAIACAVVGILAYIVWLMDVRNRNAGLTAVSFHLLTGVFGAAAVIVFGVYWDDLPNGFAFWLAVGGAALCLLVGLTVALIVICTCQGYSRKRYVRRRRVARRAASDRRPVMQSNKLTAQVPVAVPMAIPNGYITQRVLPAIAPAPAPAVEYVNTAPESNAEDLQVTAVYNGPSGGFYGGTVLPDNGQHSATVYVDNTYANTNQLFRF
ncbi:hypothetical protein CAPTEDRAFT_221067 [Capitella teleta]|uniref:Uncharacterized protein n=1 Tax=Capitella teleta TaxID=283909 RepID=R7UH24_CAPTE|nr:hypothetical protein CAPTEDRAFT_221067 [Capitella teleta]|eukprot:ELU03098.1 hypothetical protein CAPTEDRAFT_221067 [Capitella teleta]